MKQFGTALTSTLGVLLLSIFAASPSPTIGDNQDQQENTEVVRELQDSFQQLQAALEDKQNAKAEVYEQARDQLELIDDKLTQLEAKYKNSGAATDPVPDFDELPDFDAGGSDGASNTPGWEAGTISNSGGGSSGGVSASMTSLCPCDPCHCANVSMVSMPRYSYSSPTYSSQTYSGGSSGSGGFSTAMLQQRNLMSRVRASTTRVPIVQRPILQRPVLQPRSRSGNVNCANGVCVIQ